jgi:hypothetical protein
LAVVFSQNWSQVIAEKSTGGSAVFWAFAPWNEQMNRTKHRAVADFMTFPLGFIDASPTRLHAAAVQTYPCQRFLPATLRMAPVPGILQGVTVFPAVFAVRDCRQRIIGKTK